MGDPILLPVFDPFVFSLGFLGEGWAQWGIRWYGLAWLAGGAAVLLGLRAEVQRSERQLATRNQVEDGTLWVFLGIILGGRLGYVLFYGLEQLLRDPLWALRIDQGGMSFHGGVIGGMLVALWYCRRHGLRAMPHLDLAALWVPVPLGVVRVANFINGELWGRATEVPWAVVFPRDPLALGRHPSQLYEALLEGLVLWLLLRWKHRWTPAMGEGWLVGWALLYYGVLRFGVEFFREPDAHLGLQALGLTRGQWLCVPLAAAGAWLVWRAWRGGGAEGRA